MTGSPKPSLETESSRLCKLTYGPWELNAIGVICPFSYFSTFCDNSTLSSLPPTYMHRGEDLWSHLTMSDNNFRPYMFLNRGQRCKWCLFASQFQFLFSSLLQNGSSWEHVYPYQKYQLLVPSALSDKTSGSNCINQIFSTGIWKFNSQTLIYFLLDIRTVNWYKARGRIAMAWKTKQSWSAEGELCRQKCHSTLEEIVTVCDDFLVPHSNALGGHGCIFSALSL